MQRRITILAAFRKTTAALALAASATCPAAAAEDTAGVDPAPDGSCRLSAVEAGTVAEVIDGDTLRLTDGRVVRLAGIEAPKPWLVPAGGNVEAIAAEARQTLDRLAGGARIALLVGNIERDRHGRFLAQAYRDDGSWLQEALVAGGFARVRPFAGDAACLAVLAAGEREARAANRGLWRSAQFSVMSAYDPSLIARKGLYVLVEGRVVSVGRGNRMDFLNFGHYWRRDFTVMVDAAVAGQLAERGLPVDALAERWVRVRGVIEENGGPAIRLSSPGEIEVLDDG